jgi:ribosomal protein S18 acetylase RimI-like enzyme
MPTGDLPARDVPARDVPARDVPARDVPAGDLLPVSLRSARPEDYEPIAAVVDYWWGRPILGVLPRLFLDHFHRTSFVAERDNALAGFLIGFCSPSEPDEAYIHFLGVAPAERRNGLARRLYEEFFDLARAHRRSVVSAVTSPVNATSIAFHRQMGFSVSDPIPQPGQPERDLVHFRRTL